jgi:DNA-binding response OmpR family regulator
MGKSLVFTGFAPQYFCMYDHAKVEKIVANLLSNAIKNTTTGDHIAIQISHDSHSTQNQLIITISDTGRGIPAEELPYIFTRFFRGEHQESVGSGIGLSFVKELTELMHGTITAESVPGKETTFIVTLPVKVVPSISTSDVVPVVSHAQEYVQASRAETPEHGRQVILIVEDSAPIRTLIATAFADTYHILEAGDGQAGEKIALEQIPDVIITDLMMPVKDGMAMCDALKKDEKTSHIPIVMLTARADKDAMIQGYDTGADAYVIKPFEIEILTAQVRNLIQIRQTLRDKYSQRFFSGAAMLELQDADTEWCNRLRALLENHLSEEDFGIDQLSAAMNLSRRQIQRKCNALFGIPPNEFIRNYRLERAKKFLEARTGTVSEVCYAVGFSSLSYFSRCYKEYFNQLPSEIQSIEEEV